MTMNQGPEFVRKSSWWLLSACSLLALPAFGATCPAGTVELRPDIRALPARDIAMLNATSMKFSATSWNAGDGLLELVPRDPVADSTGTLRQPVDQRVRCSDGSHYDRPAGNAAYHPAHNHVHYNDYANYILEQDTSSPQNPRKGTKTTFCIMDTTGVNMQLSGASGSAVYSWCPTQEPGFNTQGMSVGWGDTYGASLSGQSLSVADLAPGMYRLRHVFDPKDLLLETSESDNESCTRIEIGDGSNGRYVADRGPCTARPVPRIDSISPASAVQKTCVNVIISGANLVPELRVDFAGGTGPLPSLKNAKFDVAGNYVTGTVCVPAVRKGKRGGLGSDPLWDVRVTAVFGGYSTVTKANLFRVTQ